MKYRLIVLDVDGTLLDSAHRLRPRVAAAVRSTQAAGAIVALATGKLLGSVLPLLAEMEVAGPQITLNGAATQESATGRALRFCPLTTACHRAVVRLVRALDPGVLISHFTLDAILMDRPHPLIPIFAEYGEAPPTLVPDLLAPDLPPAAKILLAGEPERLAVLRQAVAPRLPAQVHMTTTTPDFLEFFDIGAGKGQALAALREALGVPREAVLAIGDGENDAPLLAEAGLAVAMDNAAAVTRAAATRIAPSNDDDGVAVILEELLAAHDDRSTASPSSADAGTYSS
ncbi:MAG TPA: Cof-type HAD-IIB family hydrolase [Ktedonobacterales bacterium]|nr:Cof-type HAD-IIB family hydrolase [Ktedonobacterales bacterium]